MRLGFLFFFHESSRECMQWGQGAAWDRSISLHRELQGSGMSSLNALDSMTPEGAPAEWWIYLSACNAVQKASLKSREWRKQPRK